jgi:D-alanyl-lipoteichoic acid acyltransferase DltB (MBOAT superfamily)
MLLKHDLIRNGSTFFVWTTAWGEILTLDNLIKRGFPHCAGIVGSGWIICCFIVYGLWSVAFGALGFNRRLPKTLASLVWEALFGCIEPCPITCGLCGSKTIRYV